MRLGDRLERRFRDSRSLHTGGRDSRVESKRHLLLGAAAWNRMRGKLDQWREEMAKYESVTLGADFPEGQ